MSFTLTHCDLVHETDDAVLVRLSETDSRYEVGSDFWLPLSHVEKLVRRFQPFASEVTMTDWIATTVGLK